MPGAEALAIPGDRILALAHALLRYRYSSKDQGGKPQTTVAWLALTFALENGTWRLVFDQNTLIPAAP